MDSGSLLEVVEPAGLADELGTGSQRYSLVSKHKPRAGHAVTTEHKKGGRGAGPGGGKARILLQPC